MFGMMRKKLEVPPPEQCLPGRAIRMPVPPRHFVNGNPLEGPYPAGLETAVFGLGCFWGGRAQVLGGAGGVDHRGRLCRRLDPEPDL